MKMRNWLSVRALCEFPPARSSQIHAAGIHDQPAARFAEIRLCVYCRSCWFRSMILCKKFFIV